MYSSVKGIKFACKIEKIYRRISFLFYFIIERISNNVNILNVLQLILTFLQLEPAQNHVLTKIARNC